MTRAALILFCCSACGVERLATIETDFEVEPRVLVFPAAAVGGESRALLKVRNRTRRTQTLAVSMKAPFFSQDALQLEGGAETSLEISFRPDREGSASSVATVGGLEVRLEADALRCDAAGPCNRAILADGRCLQAAAPDGERCEDSCLVDAQCRAGACVGRARACDDGNACTADACAPGEGCVATDVSNSCAPSSHPCLAASCDPLTGCATAPVSDGTSCGAGDCVTAEICLSGACVVRAVPEGSACGEATPCRARGTCKDQQCVQPAAGVLPAAWSYTPAFPQLFFPGIADANGNLFFTECSDSHCELVSLSRDGAPRFRAPTLGFDGRKSWLDPLGTILLSGNRLVMAVFGGDLVEARSAANGALQWQHQPAVDLSPSFVTSFTCNGVTAPVEHTVHGASIVDDGAGGLYVLTTVRRRVRTGPCPTEELESGGVLSLDVATGATRWKKSLGAAVPRGALADEQGNLYLQAQTVTGSPRRLFSLDRNGLLRWERTDLSAEPVSIDAQRLILSSYEVLDAATGGTVTRVLLSRYPPLFGAQLAILSSGGNGIGASGSPPAFQINRFDLQTGAVKWSIPIPKGNGITMIASQPVLTAADELLIAAGPYAAASGGEVSLRALANGVERFACRLDGNDRGFSAPTLRGGRFAVASHGTSPLSSRIRSYAIPGAEPALDGWVTHGGKMTKENRPR